MVVRLLHVVAVLALVCSGVSSATAAHPSLPADSPLGADPGWPPTMGAASAQVRPQVPPGATAPQATGQGRPGAPARDAAPPPSATGTAVITGQVATADGRPVRKAAIRASSPGLRESRSAATDANGRYELTNLPAGRYTLYASKGGYQGVSFGATAEGLPGKPIDVGDKARIEGVDFVLPRGCVITGRVYDEFGEPASEVNMAAALERSVGGRRRLMQTGSGRSTDDRGEFRLFNLRPGDYLVSGTLRQPGSTAPRTEAEREGYAATYYPGTPSPAEARRIPCVAGQETTGIDFTLATVRTVQVSGRVLDAQGRPASGFVSLRPARNELYAMTGGGQVRPDGSFNIFNVVPGEYYLQAMTTSAGPTGPRQFAYQPVNVTDTDITGLVLQLGPGARLSGRVLMEGQEPFDFQRSNVRIGLQSLEPDSPGSMVGSSSGMAQPDGSFDLPGLFGQFLVRAYGPSGAWRLKTVRVDGRDVTDVPLDLRGNVEVKDVELVLTNRLSTLTVTVQDERGAPVSDAMVIVFADDVERWRYPSRFVAVARPTSSTDPYKITTLPPGRYLAAAIPFDPQGDPMDPALLERLRPDAERVTLTDGETVTLTLKKTVGGR